MRREHFASLRPVCPRCLTEHEREARLTLGETSHERGESIEEGILHCPDEECRQEYPIIDGVPLIVPGVRRYVSDNLFHLTLRDDLAESTESLVGDAVGPATLFNVTRQHLSTYAWDHFADLDPGEPATGRRPGAVAGCLKEGLGLVEGDVAGPILDLGCSVGRSTFELATRFPGPVLGIDVNFSMLRLAARILSSGRVRYPRRRVGVVYDRRDFEVRFDRSERVDFWVCDALALPFSADTFDLAVGLNLLDCVASPAGCLASLDRVLRPGGSAVLSTPYDWSSSATPIEAWVGGHSQRGPECGASEPLLRRLLTPGAHPCSANRLTLCGEKSGVGWWTRLHDRCITSYDVHVVAARRSY